MKTFLTILVTLFITATVFCADKASIEAECKNGLARCIGFNKEDSTGSNDCSRDVSTCEFAYASIKKATNPAALVGQTAYRVTLVGKGSGWVSIGFSNDESGIMRENNLAIVCLNGINPKVQILQLQARPPPENTEKKPIQFDNNSLNSTICEESLQAIDNWLICEFNLNTKPNNGLITLDLQSNAYKIGLAVNVEQSIDSGNPTSPVYHGQTRGSSAKKLTVFQKLL